MNRWSWEKKQFFTLLFAALIVGFFIGHLLELFFLVVLGLWIRQIILIDRLERWLAQGAIGDNKKIKGIWGNIYYHFYKLKKKQKNNKKKLGKVLMRYRKSTDALPDAAVVLGDYGRVEWINIAARKVLHLKKADIGSRITNIIRVPEFVQYFNTGDYHQKICITSPADENNILEITIVPYGSGMRLLIAQDITQIRRVETMRKDFVANVSHELRTPLTVLKGYLETLRDMDDGESVYSRSLEQMDVQTQHMEHLVDDLLMLIRLETTKRITECVNVPELLNELCCNVEITENSLQRINLRLACEAKILGEKSELRSAVTNLIVNALKYSPDDAKVNVVWRLNDPGEACLSVEDSGEGIPAAEIPRLTERFYRVDVQRDHKVNGTGLGLAIVKHVLARHDARLEVESQLGRGSCFNVIFSGERLC